jgi:arginine/ornithine N-succinyltransferase beta subunit
MKQHLNRLACLRTEPRPRGPEALYEAGAAVAAPQDRPVAGVRQPSEDMESYRFLVARPAARPDLAAMLEINRHVNIASMRGEEEKNLLAIEQSTRTLAGDLPWQQGLLLLSADLYPLDGATAELAGTIKLQVGWGGCWRKTRHARLFNVPGLKTWAESEYLTYQPNDPGEYTLELAGLSVHPSHRGKKVARFLTQAWALLVLTYQEELQRRIGTITSLYANVLTADAQGKYAFYERVVRQLFGNLDYDTVDAYRYARCNARSPILDEFLDERGEQPRARILYGLLPDELRRDLGKVREQSVGCQKNLEKLGFCRTDKYDVLDGGQYFENTLARLARTVKQRDYRVRCVRENEIPAGSPRLTLAPADRPMTAFGCVRAACRVQGDELFLAEEACDALLLGQHERVVALAAPTPSRRQDDVCRA